MRNAVLLVGFVCITACSLDHIVVASLDDTSSGAPSMTVAGSASAGAGAGTAGSGGLGGNAASGGSGGVIASAGARATNETPGDSFSTGGITTTFTGTNLGDAGAASEIRCSCLGSSSYVCGTDGVTYSAACVDSGACTTPGIECLQACPCPESGVGGAPTSVPTLFTIECAATAHCSEGVICSKFSSVTFNDAPTDCINGN